MWQCAPQHQGVSQKHHVINITYIILIFLPHVFSLMHLVLQINFLLTLLSSSETVSEGHYRCVFAQVNVILFQLTMNDVQIFISHVI